MPTFYKEKELTPEQHSRINRATDKYETLQVINANQAVSLLSIEEKEKIKKSNNLKNDAELQAYFLRLNSFHSPGEKSALFYRLLNGKKPLKYPPPTSYSYPWYDIVEKPQAQEVFEEYKTINEFFYKGLDGISSGNKTKMIIRQGVWEVENIISETEAIVTYPLWKAIGFKWSLKYVKTPIAESNATIHSQYDRSLDTIRTLEQLRAEQKWHIVQKIEEIKKLLSVAHQQDYKNEMVEMYGADFAKSLIDTKLANAIREIKGRQMKSLPDYPSEEEIEMMVDTQINRYLDKNYSVDSQGNLYVNTWLLKRLSGKTENLYL